jgi:hypothetical protein
MILSQLSAVLDRLESLTPQRRTTEKRKQLTEVRERLLALHARGHSWRSIARELSAQGDKVSPDLLRLVCTTNKRAPRILKRTRHRATKIISSGEPSKPVVRAEAKQRAASESPGFGAKGLKL